MRKNSKNLTAFLLTFLVGGLFAQNTTTIPLDPDVKHGKLSNGMSYYVMHNEEPKERAMFMFVQNVGAILEEDSQNGLAHFLEHMAFNGLEHYPGKEMLNYLEINGIEFGRDINAYTAQDETVYYINNVPTDNENLMDSTLLVLHDWSGGLLLEGEEIEAERGVIHEEWRTRRNANFRLRKQSSPYLYNHSKYVDRDVIGDLEVIDNFEHEELRKYYKKWYRPDLQAVVVVGDFDTETMEKKVKDLFSKIPMKDNAAERKYYEVEDSKELAYVLGKDKEANMPSLMWLFRSDAEKNRDEAYLRSELARGMFNTMLNNRYKELMQQPECPALHMGVGNFELTRTKDASYLNLYPKEKKELEAFELLLVEFERVKRFGFTQSELTRTKIQLIRQYEAYYDDRAKINNNEWAQQFADHFLSASPVPDIDQEVEFAKKTIQDIRLEEVVAFVEEYSNVNNSVISVSGPDKEETFYPSKEELLVIKEKVKSSKLEAYVDDAVDAPLVTDELSDSTSYSVTTLKGVDAKLYVLENGVQVVIYPTEFSKDEVLFNATSFGGTSTLEQGDLVSGEMVSTLAQVSGVGEFDAIQLKKKLTGKIVKLSTTVGTYTTGMQGAASPKDLEILLQLIYLSFEHPRYDESAFAAQADLYKNYVANIKTDNGRAFNDTVSELATNRNPRNIMLGDEFVANIKFESAKEIYADFYNDANDYKFVFVGNINEETDLPLILKYLGALETKEEDAVWVDNNVRPADGFTERIFEREMQVEKSTVYHGIFNQVEYNLKNRILVRVVGDLLDKRYLETIREEEGGSYGVSVRPSVRKLPYEHFSIGIKFDCDPEKQERLYEIVLEQIDNLVANGPEADDLKEIKENYLNNREEQSKQNRFWQSVIKNSLLYDEAIASNEEYNALVNSITEKEIQKFAKQMFSKEHNAIKVVMLPKK